MARKMMVTTGVMLLVVGALVGCAKAPQQSIDQARTALDQAQKAQAPDYAPQAWDQAQQSMTAAMAEVEAQNAKFAPLRSYKNAGQLVETAREEAVKAEQAAVAGREQAKTEAETAVSDVKGSLDRANELLDQLGRCRRRPKGFASDLQLMRGNVDGLAQQLTDVESAMSSESYLQARTLAEELKSQVDTVVKDLESAKAKIGC